jgi:hypothetical protein
MSFVFGRKILKHTLYKGAMMEICIIVNHLSYICWEFFFTLVFKLHIILSCSCFTNGYDVTPKEFIKITKNTWR